MSNIKVNNAKFVQVLRKTNIKLKLSSDKYVLYKISLLNQKKESTKNLERIKHLRLKHDCLTKITYKRNLKFTCRTLIFLYSV